VVKQSQAFGKGEGILRVKALEVIAEDCEREKTL
jgi:hypothetical protein